MKTVTLTQLIKTLIDGNDYPEETNIIINKNELTYDKVLSVYNNIYYIHQPTGAFLYVQHFDDENDVKINIILPGETLKDSYGKHHLTDDWADNPYVWDKLDDDYDSTKDEFTVEYKYEII